MILTSSDTSSKRFPWASQFALQERCTNLLKRNKQLHTVRSLMQLVIKQAYVESQLRGAALVKRLTANRRTLNVPPSDARAKTEASAILISAVWHSDYILYVCCEPFANHKAISKTHFQSKACLV